MKRTLLFEDNGITVHREQYMDERGVCYWVSDGETSFSTYETPPLNYASLYEALADYKYEKEQAIAQDVQNDDIRGNWEEGTEGF